MFDMLTKKWCDTSICKIKIQNKLWWQLLKVKTSQTRVNRVLNDRIYNDKFKLCVLDLTKLTLPGKILYLKFKILSFSGNVKSITSKYLT